jgi:hypothetical protein
MSYSEKDGQVVITMNKDWHTCAGPDGGDNPLVRTARASIWTLLRSEHSAVEVYNGLMYIQDTCREALCQLDEDMTRLNSVTPDTQDQTVKVG